MTFATHPQRQFMEYLRGSGWVKATMLPPSRLLVSLQKKGWIEQQLQGPKNEIFYRMTDVGLKALRAPVPAGSAVQGEGEMRQILKPEAGLKVGDQVDR